MDYAISFVDDLPEGHDFMLIRRPDTVLIFYRECALTPEVLEDSWAAYRALIAPRPTGTRILAAV